MSRPEPDFDPAGIDHREDPAPIVSRHRYEQAQGDLIHADDRLRRTLDQLSRAETRADLAEEACERARATAVALEQELAERGRGFAPCCWSDEGCPDCGDWTVPCECESGVWGARPITDVDTGGRI